MARNNYRIGIDLQISHEFFCAPTTDIPYGSQIIEFLVKRMKMGKDM
jgi:hypothetical protein